MLRRPYRLTTALVAAVLLLTSCGGQPAPPTAEAPAASASTDAPAAGSEPIIVTHELGTTELPQPAQRVLVLDYSFLDMLLALDTPPVGATLDTQGDRGAPAYLVPMLDGVVSVGSRAEPNLESIVAAQPDLIIADQTAQGEMYEQLSQIAPTVVYNNRRGSYDDVMEQLLEIGRMIGKEAEAQAVVDASAAQLASASGLVDPDAPPIVMAVTTPRGTYVHSTESFVGSLLGTIGRPSAVAPQAGESQFEVSFEGFVTLEPQVLVFFTGADEVPIVREWSQNPLWAQLPAVQNGRVYEFDRDLWTRSRGPLAIKLMIEQATTSGMLANTDPSAEYAFRAQ